VNNKLFQLTQYLDIILLYCINQMSQRLLMELRIKLHLFRCWEH